MHVWTKRIDVCFEKRKRGEPLCTFSPHDSRSVSSSFSTMSSTSSLSGLSKLSDASGLTLSTGSRKTCALCSTHISTLIPALISTFASVTGVAVVRESVGKKEALTRTCSSSDRLRNVFRRCIHKVWSCSSCLCSLISHSSLFHFFTILLSLHEQRSRCRPAYKKTSR